MTETTPEERAELQTEYMAENLALTAEQKPAVQAINLKYAQKIDVVYKTETAKLQRFRKMKSVTEEKDRELKKALTSEQYAQYEKNKEEMWEKIKERREN
jgi:hypothetical protein